VNYPDPVDRAKREEENRQEDAALVEARRLLGPYAIVESEHGGSGEKRVGVLHITSSFPQPGPWLATGATWEDAFAHIHRLLSNGLTVRTVERERGGILFHGADVDYGKPLPTPDPDALMEEEDDGNGSYECPECGSTYHPSSECPFLVERVEQEDA